MLDLPRDVNETKLARILEWVSITSLITRLLKENCYMSATASMSLEQFNSTFDSHYFAATVTL